MKRIGSLENMVHVKSAEWPCFRAANASTDPSPTCCLVRQHSVQFSVCLKPIHTNCTLLLVFNYRSSDAGY